MTPFVSPRYKLHRAVDDRCGVVTATVTTPGDIAEPTQTVPLIVQHERHSGGTLGTVVGDQQYGTIDNHRTLQQRGLRTHLKTTPGRPPPPDRFPQDAFRYDAATDRFECPARQWLYPRGYDPRRQHTEYVARKGVCAACPLRPQCTTSKHSRMVHRYREHERVLHARVQAQSREAKRDYARRRHLMEGSFAQSVNCHGGKRARWRRLWRQRIQDWLIAACLNVKLLVKALRPGPLAGAGRLVAGLLRSANSFALRFCACSDKIRRFSAPALIPPPQLN